MSLMNKHTVGGGEVWLAGTWGTEMSSPGEEQIKTYQGPGQPHSPK